MIMLCRSRISAATGLDGGGRFRPHSAYRLGAAINAAVPVKNEVIAVILKTGIFIIPNSRVLVLFTFIQSTIVAHHGATPN